jgi:hypothetical protein
LIENLEFCTEYPVHAIAVGVILDGVLRHRLSILRWLIVHWLGLLFLGMTINYHAKVLTATSHGINAQI